MEIFLTSKIDARKQENYSLKKIWSINEQRKIYQITTETNQCKDINNNNYNNDNNNATDNKIHNWQNIVYKQ